MAISQVGGWVQNQKGKSFMASLQPVFSFSNQLSGVIGAGSQRCFNMYAHYDSVSAELAYGQRVFRGDYCFRLGRVETIYLKDKPIYIKAQAYALGEV